MKKPIILLIFFSFLLNGIIAQSCFPNGINFYKQSDIDEFVVNNPTCNIILGDVEIWPIEGEINNLDPLNQITKIGGTLKLTDLPMVNSFDGLQNIDSIGGSLFMNRLPTMENLNSFRNLKTIGGGLSIADMENLKSLDGLQNIQKINAQLGLIRCEQLETLNGLNNLDSVGWYLEIYGNKILTSLEGLDNLKFINFYLEIINNESLLDFSGMELTNHIGGGLRIEDNLVLKSFNGLGNLDTIQRKFKISGNNELVTFDGLNTYIKPDTQVDISENSKLTVCNQPFLCDFVNRDFDEFVIIIIRDNDENCNSFGEVFVSCDPIKRCAPNEIYFTEQSEIDNFIIENPTCKEAFAHLTINDDIQFQQITNLKGFSNLEILHTGITVYQTKTTTLEGLENIKYCRSMDIYENPQLENVDHLSKLTKAYHINISDNQSLTNVDGLTNLDTILQDISISFMDNFIDTKGLSNLKYVAEFLSLNDLPALEDLGGFPNLEYVGERVDIDFTGLTNIYGFEKLTNANWLRFNENPNIESFSGFGNLTAIEHIEMRNTLGAMNFDAFQNLDSIRGDLLLKDNEKIVDFKGFPNLKFIGHQLYFNEHPNIEAITGFNNLTYVERGIQIQTESPLLNDLSGFSNLSYTGVLTITDNPGIDNLSFLNLNKIGNSLSIQDTKLINLDGFENADLTNATNVVLWNNPNLEFCSNTPICRFALAGGDLQIQNNAIGCNTRNEILNDCSLDFAKLRYATFYDRNQDDIRQSGEPFQPDIQIEIPSENLNLVGRIDSLGLTFLRFGNYDVVHVPTANWQLTSTASIPISFDSNTDCDTILFGVYPQNLVSEITPIINAPRARCNETIFVSLSAKNSGNTFTDGILWIELDSNLQAVLFNIPPDDSIANYTYGWKFSDLAPGHIYEQIIQVKIPGPLDFMLGDELIFNAYSDFSDDVGNHTSSTFRYHTILRCSYDPNDKLVNPSRNGNYTLFEETLIYTIRFQNTGNDVAYDVKITDVLDEHLEPSTFQILNSSHYEVLSTIIENDRYLIFEFKDIFLPDSTANFDESQGFVSYQIEPKNALSENTPINNTASIFFDFNPPVVTNTTENIMVSELPTSGLQPIDNQLNVLLYPNPTDGKIYLSGNNLQNATVIVSDPTGRILQVEKLNGTNFIHLPEEVTGLLFLKIETEEGTAIKRVLKF